jgi:hypothetical protein
MKIYIVTQGTYSDYHICAVATDEEKAKQLAEKHATSYDETRVEVYDTTEDDPHADGRIPFCVTFVGGCAEHYYIDRPPLYLEGVPFTTGITIRRGALGAASTNIEVRLYAPNERAAVKVAAEKRAEFLARKEGL